MAAHRPAAPAMAVAGLPLKPSSNAILERRALDFSKTPNARPPA